MHQSIKVEFVKNTIYIYMIFYAIECHRQVIYDLYRKEHTHDEAQYDRNRLHLSV